MRRTLIVIAVAGVVVAGLAALAARPLLGTLIEWQAAARGVEGVSLRVTSLSASELRLADVRIDDPALGLRGVIDSISARFSLGELLDGRLRELVIDGGELHFPAPAAEPDQPAAPPLALIPTLPLAAPPWLPQRLRVRDLTLVEPDGGRRWRADAQIGVEAGRPVGEALLASTDAPTAARLAMAADGTLQVLLPAAGDGAPALSAAVAPAAPGRVFAVDASARLAALRSWLSLVPGAAVADDLSGTLAVTGTVDISATDSVRLAIDLGVDDLAAGGYRVDAGSARVRGVFERAAGRWAADPDSTLVADGLATPYGSAARLEAGGALRLVFGDGGGLGAAHPDLTLALRQPAVAGQQAAAARVVLRGDLRLGPGSLSWDAATDAGIEIDGLRAENLAVERARLTGGYAIRLAESGLVLAPATATRLSLTGLTGAGLRVPVLELAHADSEIPPGRGPRIAPSSWTAPALRIEDRSGAVVVDAGEATLELTRAVLEPLRIAAVIRATAMTVVPGDPGVPLLQPQVSLDIDGGSIRAEASARLADGIAPASAVYARAGDADPGTLTWSAGPLDLGAGGRPLSAYLEQWPLPADLVTGAVTVDGRLSLVRDPPVGDVTVTIAAGGGAWEPFYFSDLELRLPLSVTFADAPALRAEPAPVHIGEVDAGLVLSGVDGTIGLEPAAAGPLPRLLLGPFSAQLLDGRMHIGPAAFDLNDPGGALAVRLDDIDLGELIRLQNVDGLLASGRIDGSLPVRFGDAGPSVDAGTLDAREPGGRIEYRPPGDRAALDASTPLTGVVLDALEDFNYRLLHADVRLAPDGDTAIRLEIQGISPKVSATRPVHLNIHLEQNVYDLVRSLRFVEGINEQLDRRVQEYYQSR